MEAEQRGHAFDPVLPERAEHPPTRMLSVDSVDAELGDQRVVETDDYSPPRRRSPLARPTARLHVAHDPLRRGRKPLDGSSRAIRHSIACPVRRTSSWRSHSGPRRDQHLLADEVEPCDQLGNRVLHLDPGVHLEEEVLAFLREQLDRPGRAVADGLGRVDGDLPDPLAEILRHGGRRGLLDRPGDDAGSCSRAHRDGRRRRAHRRSPGPRRAAGPRGNARHRPPDRRSRPRPLCGRTRRHARPRPPSERPEALPASACRGLDRDRPAEPLPARERPRPSRPAPSSRG